MNDEVSGVRLTASDSSGFIHDPDGMDEGKLAFLKDLKEQRRGRIHEYAERYKKSTFHKGQDPWGVQTELAFPCATQNELTGKDAAALVKNGVIAVAEGANMPCTLEAVETFLRASTMFAPAKAANAGGVAVSGLEQSQNALRISWSREEVESRLVEIMAKIHERCVEHGSQNGQVNYVKGANVAGFEKVARAMMAYGVV